MKRFVIYTGFNNPRTYKRGVDNVIEIQARSLGPGPRKIYLFFDKETSVFRWNDILCIGMRKGPLRFFRLNAIAMRLIKRARARNYKVIVHSHNSLMSLFLFCRTDIFTVHDGFWYQKKTMNSRFPRLFWAVERIVYRRVDLVHCVSNFTYSASQLPDMKKDTRVIYISTPVEDYLPSALVCPPSTPPRATVFSVRSIELRARIDLVIDIAALAQERSLDMDFVVAGKGPLLAHYRKMIEDRGLRNIRLLGFITDGDLVVRYKACDCVLVPCENGEGFGLPIIEGYLFGKPVVASGRCAIPEVISDPKYLSRNDAEEMLRILQATLTEHRDAAYFRGHYDKHFSNAVVLKQFASLYDEVFG
jgi:glycosyltransferase involved in cell wall biosynthesis